MFLVGLGDVFGCGISSSDVFEIQMGRVLVSFEYLEVYFYFRPFVFCGVFFVVLDFS